MYFTEVVLCYMIIVVVLTIILSEIQSYYDKKKSPTCANRVDNYIVMFAVILFASIPIFAIIVGFIYSNNGFIH